MPNDLCFVRLIHCSREAGVVHCDSTDERAPGRALRTTQSPPGVFCSRLPSRNSRRPITDRNAGFGVPCDAASSSWTIRLMCSEGEHPGRQQHQCTQIVAKFEGHIHCQRGATAPAHKVGSLPSSFSMILQKSETSIWRDGTPA